MSYFLFAKQLADRDEGCRYQDKLTCCECNAHRLEADCNKGDLCPEKQLSNEAQAQIWTRITSTIDQETSCKQ